MSESPEELIARRDALIEQLQGEWVVDVDLRSMNRKAMVAAGISMLAFSVFITLALIAMFFTASSAENPLAGLVPFFIAIVFIVGAAFYVYIWGHALWYRRLKPIVISENRLVWDKRKGFVPERLDLLNVSSVIRYDGSGSNRLVMGLINAMEKRSSTSLSPVILISRGEHNTPKIIPAMFKDGHKLITAIEKLAEINTKLDELIELESA